MSYLHPNCELMIAFVIRTRQLVIADNRFSKYFHNALGINNMPRNQRKRFNNK